MWAGEFSDAAENLRTALETVGSVQAPAWQVQCLPAAALLAAHGGELERAADLLALSFHHPAAATGWLEKFPLVGRLRERLEAELVAEAFTAAWERGDTLDLAETVEKLMKMRPGC